jgi:uncharacterized protein (TIGR04255 family)
MPFTARERVKYENQPLDNVICQIRFPTILKVDTELPSALQTKIGDEYINFVEGQEISIDIQLLNVGLSQRDEMKQLPKTIKNYEFASEDNQWKVNLTRNFISLATTNYENWEGFRGRLVKIFSSFVEVYNPTLFTRVGLRYTDIIVRSKLDLGDTSWKELIAENMLGVLATPELRENIVDFQSNFVVQLNDKESLVRVTTGTVKAVNSGETCFIIDSDIFSTRKRKSDEIVTKLDYYHEKAFGLFRYCITEKLHQAMKPRKI